MDYLSEEGEIDESELHKAKMDQPRAKHKHVNPSLRDTLSPTSDRRTRRSSTASSNTTSRSQTRSPSRDVRFKYDKYNSHSRGRLGRDDIKWSRDGRYDDKRGSRRRRKRSRSPSSSRSTSRSRSRSPHREKKSKRESRVHNHENNGYSNRDPKRSLKSDDFAKFDRAGFHKRSKQQSVNDQRTFVAAGSLSPVPESVVKDTSNVRIENVNQSNSHQAEKRSDNRTQMNQRHNENAEESGQPTEDLSIEERRKRREAIKAKYKALSTPTAVQSPQLAQITGDLALQVSTPGASEGQTPVDEGQSPRTPQTESGPASPPTFAISNDTDLARNSTANTSGDAVDEPSAADYDPKMDMPEDRARNEENKSPDVDAMDYDETKDRNQDVLFPDLSTDQKEETKAADKRKASDDMFASEEEEEDDMFAPEPVKKAKIESLKPKNVPQAKELDQSLLDNWDDSEGYYRIIVGELLNGRYHIQTNLGKGMFSSVVRAQDNKTNKLVAIKIIRNNESMIKAGEKEMEILQKLADADPDDKKHLIRLERSFTHKDHLCMVFENLSINLREVLKKFGRDVGINLKAVRTYAQQMFLGLSLLRKCNILHADLKPDNILVNEARNSLKICDLGSAADASESDITPYLVSRFYRAPEIILGIPYDFSIDMWSIGCTLFELYTGKILFTGRTNNQMLKSIMECRGKFSLKMLKKAEFGAVHFDDKTLQFKSVERDKLSGRDVTRLINFVKPSRDLKTRLLAAAGSGNTSGGQLGEAEVKEVNLFADLLERCLALNPERRITPADALQHPFVKRSGPSHASSGSGSGSGFGIGSGSGSGKGWSSGGFKKKGGS